VQKEQREEAAWLLKMWGFLDHDELWYELFAAGSLIRIKKNWIFQSCYLKLLRTSRRTLKGRGFYFVVGSEERYELGQTAAEIPLVSGAEVCRLSPRQSFGGSASDC